MAPAGALGAPGEALAILELAEVVQRVEISGIIVHQQGPCLPRLGVGGLELEPALPLVHQLEGQLATVAEPGEVPNEGHYFGAARNPGHLFGVDVHHVQLERGVGVRGEGVAEELDRRLPIEAPQNRVLVDAPLIGLEVGDPAAVGRPDEPRPRVQKAHQIVLRGAGGQALLLAGAGVAEE